MCSICSPRVKRDLVLFVAGLFCFVVKILNVREKLSSEKSLCSGNVLA